MFWNSLLMLLEKVLSRDPLRHFNKDKASVRLLVFILDRLFLLALVALVVGAYALA